MLRKTLRQRRNALSPDEQADHARRALSLIATFPAFHTAKHLAFYWPDDGELDPRPIITLAQSQGKTCYLPRIETEKLIFALFDNPLSLEAGPFGILAPPQTAPTRPYHELDMIFIPSVGFRRDGKRLGRGGGFYDKTLAPTKPAPWYIGMAHSCQHAPSFSPKSHDLVCHAILTEQEFLLIS